MRPHLAVLPVVLLAAPAGAQSFVLVDHWLPQGSPFNDSSSENVDFGDVDLDGDFDAYVADGGDCCNDHNRMWINLGGLQAGSIGFFGDETATRLPDVMDDSRDGEFVDFDADGDLDVYVSNTAQIANQSNRFLVNSGKAQGGTLGFFVDETLARWVGISDPGSSVAPTLKLASGGFVDWSCDSDFGDLDNDGDLDLVHTTYGGTFAGNVPTRLFLNDGDGFFSEFNPSGHQLTGSTIANGDPALWAEGSHKHGTLNTTGLEADIADTPLDLELGDIDADLDLDLLHGSRNSPPRLFRNRLEESGGTLSMRDETSDLFTVLASGGGNYEQELGDVDNDGDLDVYGVNWQGFTDTVALNDGTGHYGFPITVPASGLDDQEADFGDYDNDGDLDAFVSAFGGQDKLFQNDVGGGAPVSFSDVTGAEVPVYGGVTLDADWFDVDNDGDYDIMTATDNGGANRLLLNQSQIADTRPSFPTHLEQAPDRLSSSSPTVVRAHVYGNAAYYVTWYDQVFLEFRIDGFVWYFLPMRSSGGQVFRGELPGAVIGQVEYRVRARDRYGNEATTPSRFFTASDGGCNGAISTYCTTKANSVPGCTPAFGFNGVPSASALTGFTIEYRPVPGANPGLFIYTTNGAAATPIQNAFGWLCVQPGAGLFRIGLQSAGGTGGACDGSYGINFNQHFASQTQNPSLVQGATVDMQVWYRDPPNPGTANLSNAARFTICP